jgi:sulfoxide reductase heme-binding subunit YedZ
MGVEYTSVQWNRQKRLYDFALVGGVALFLLAFASLTKSLFPFITDEILIIRTFGTTAFVLLHIILCIGPLCRLNPKFLPLLYNRRHAGVTMFLLALIHSVMVIATYHAGSDTNPILSIFVSSPLTGSVAGVPFQPLGFFALVILFLMAATSHDFWLANLSAPVWKSLHMMVYVAYALLVLHVTFGTMQGEASPVYVGAMAFGLATVLGLHIASARSEAAIDRGTNICSSRREEAQTSKAEIEVDGFMDACAVADIPENRAHMVCLSGERVAIFKYEGKISAVSNVCQHQNGPLGEGKIVFGCITCPWHGYQYVPETGASPPPFVEKVPTFNVRVKSGRVLVHPKPNPAGTKAEPALIEK